MSFLRLRRHNVPKSDIKNWWNTIWTAETQTSVWNILDKTPRQTSAREGERPPEMSLELWKLLKEGKLASTLLWGGVDKKFRGRKWMGWKGFWKK